MSLHKIITVTIFQGKLSEYVTILKGLPIYQNSSKCGHFFGNIYPVQMIACNWIGYGELIMETVLNYLI